MTDESGEVLRSFRRKRDISKIETAALADELCSCVDWDESLRSILFHGDTPPTPGERKKLIYHIDKNALYIAEIYDELIRRGKSGISEIEKLYLKGDPEVIFQLGNAHVEYFPETARKVLTLLLSDDSLEEKHRHALSKRLGAVNQRLTGGF